VKTQKERKETNLKSCKNGHNFESLISNSCKKYYASGEACIAKTPEPFVVFSRTKEGLFQGRFVNSKAQPDFQGTVSGGRSIIMEAKSTAKDRILQNVLTDNQNEILEKNSSLGALCFVIISIQERYFLMPYDIWKNMENIYGRKYVKNSDINEFEIVSKKGNKLPFLDIVNKQLQ
jgi:recombination protein U